MILLILWQALWAASIPISKILLSYSPPVFLAGIRMVCAGVLLLGYHYLFKRNKIVLPRAEWWLYLQVIFFGIYIKYIFRYIGLSSMPSTKLAFMLNLTPFCVAFGSYLAFREVLLYKQWIGLMIGFIGFSPLLLIGNVDNTFITWANFAVIAEILAHSYSIILLRKLVCDRGHSSSMTNGIRMFGGGILALMTSCYAETSVSINGKCYFFLWLAVLIVLSNIICHNWHLILLKQYSATFLTFTDFLSPLFVSFYGWIFFQEVTTWHHGVSAVCVFIGLYLFYYDELLKQKKKPLAGTKLVGIMVDDKESVAYKGNLT